MELQQLKYFQTVARLEHMTRAAEELHITQPSLSITIGRLEDALGVPLFDRYGRQIKLNEYGKIFLKRIERAFSELEEGKREVTDLAGLDYGTVSVASTNQVLLPELLQSFLSMYPQMKFRLFQDSILTMQQQLQNGAVDFCISSPLVQGQGISGVPLLEEEIVLAVPMGHRLAGQSSISLNEVVHESFISLKAGYGIRDMTDEFCRQAGFSPNITFEVNEPSLVGNLVKSGLGIAFIPMNAWKESISSSTVRLHIKDPACQRIIGLSWLEERYLSAAAHRFRQFVIDYFTQFER
jgi:DNA-binding transcriptional LysR family regulator